MHGGNLKPFSSI